MSPKPRPRRPSWSTARSCRRRRPLRGTGRRPPAGTGAPVARTHDARTAQPLRSGTAGTGLPPRPARKRHSPPCCGEARPRTSSPPTRSLFVITRRMGTAPRSPHGTVAVAGELRSRAAPRRWCTFAGLAVRRAAHPARARSSSPAALLPRRMPANPARPAVFDVHRPGRASCASWRGHVRGRRGRPSGTWGADRAVPRARPGLRAERRTERPVLLLHAAARGERDRWPTRPRPPLVAEGRPHPHPRGDPRRRPGPRPRPRA
ncbi:hypothetical protein STENM327S_08302 [Streptomyces tendae]